MCRVVFGTNPIAFGIPQAAGPPLTFDMATSAIALFGMPSASNPPCSLSTRALHWVCGGILARLLASLPHGHRMLLGDHSETYSKFGHHCQTR